MGTYFYSLKLLDVALVLIIMIFAPFQIDSQNLITGQVVDEKQKPVEYANIILKSGKQILQFASSNSDGKWSFKINAKSDSLNLLITHLSYDNTSIQIIPGKEYYEISLSDRSESLPVVSIKASPIEKRGDTLIFNIQSYVEKGDQSVEDALARIPGISVDDNGTISYKGLEINKFYIEGMDLLEGRYRIATRNLGLENILDVEVIERHQPIKALDSIYRPENAAINLKLKSNVAVTGAVEGELIAPLAGLSSTNWFGFSKNYQFNVSGSYNDIGRTLANDFTSSYSQMSIFENDLISFRDHYSPTLKFNREVLNFNREGTVGLNYLQQLGKITQIKVQGFLIIDKRFQLQEKQFEFRGNNSIFELNEDFQLNISPFEIQSKFILEHNAPRFYTRINTEFKNVSTDFSSMAVINNQSTKEFMVKQMQSIISNGEFVFSKDKRAITIKSIFSYTNKDYDFSIDRTYIVFPSLEEKLYTNLGQKANLETYYFQLQSKYFYHLKYISGFLELLPEWSLASVISSTLARDTLISPLFSNQTITNAFDFNINQSWTYEKNKLRLTLRLPASISTLSRFQKEESPSKTIVFPAYKARLVGSYKIRQNEAIGLFAAYTSEVLTQPNIFYDGFIVSENRRILNNVFFPNHVRNKSFGIFWNGGSAFQKIFFRNNLTYSHRKSDLLTNYSFNDFGTAEGVSNVENQSQILMFENVIEVQPGNRWDFKWDTRIFVNQR